ncbi:translocase MPT [Gracilaria domingensis]|nr:translocase MPT [Gracilaria domingensis]
MEAQAATPENAQEPELFAASASEKAITAGKTESTVSDLSALSEEAVSATRKELDEPHEVVERNDSGEPTNSSALVDSESSKGEQELLRPEADDSNERTLTKEELIEEALNCPCIAPMKEGSCGDSFIEAYKCFLQSETEPKGMDCMEQFKTMQSCLAEHPEEYNLEDDETDADPFAATRDKGEQDSPQIAVESSSA